ncbi:MAG: response regulator [Patescibacteria group bacterium]|nr:response regulator [Patescibacteria group bacterium]
MAKIKILIAEDDVSLAKLYDKKFEGKGYEVILAGNGKEAIDRAKKEEPDVILLDVMMPVMNGFEALKSLKDFEETKNIPVVILSNYGELPNITQGFNEGAADYLIKVEQTPEDVVETVEKVLKDKRPIISEAFQESEL